ncbi:Putative zn(2)Cys(6) fungal-type DNA-binding domain-containing protein [Colletotrichum destructivum]|uniref:Zn(2)Cys(6) fungal-type DNA-binding domain-containing protein n=1 Tax=Colletotrichum destructivum TaxID=34406 RepID=A0AAX4I8A9_9PEZI|nr:Putative zn(2)Cys(6) fungal-type DNA-binding domain-containing protein [Colletotrichum destructivum]
MTNGSSLAMRLALGQRPQLTRASRPKVRTGCITCKRRHRKCDEGRPACATCLTYQGYCGGYAANNKQTLDRNRPIHPKPARSQTKHDMLLEPNYASLVFSGQLEKDHFDYWLAFTETTVLFRSDLLTQVIPQLSWKDPAIKHAALAIGASALGRNTREQRILGIGELNPAALKHYSKALSLLYTSPMSPEKTLLACLLFIIFECLRGNSTAGLSHINHGFQILDQYQHSQSNKPSPLLLNEVITSFQHFGQQAWALNGIHPRETHERVPWCCRGARTRYAVQEMPIFFETLEMARYWWDIVRHHVEHHAPFYTNFQVMGSSPRVAQRPPKGYGSSESSSRHIRSFVRYLDAWNTAFLPLAIASESRKGICLADYLKALSLRVHYLYLWTGVRSAGWTDAEEAKRILPTFCDIVALSRQLLAAQAARQRSMVDGEVFTMEDSPTWPLACTYRVCTDPRVRMEIVRLFKEYPRRDGLLDTHAFLVMMEWMAKTASAGVIAHDQSPVDDCIVFHENTVVLQRRLWDPRVARWNDRNITLSIG